MINSFFLRSTVVLMLMSGAVSLWGSAEQAVSDELTASINAYVEGDYAGALKYLAEARERDPQNESLKLFSSKILTEAASKATLRHKYAQALAYLEEARLVDPSNRELLRLYLATKRLVSDSENTIEKGENPFEEFKSFMVNPNQNQQDEKTFSLQNVKTTLIWTLISTFLAMILGLLLWLKNTKMTQIEQSLMNARNELKRLVDDRNVLLSKLIQSQDESAYERVALMAENLYDTNPGEALTFLSSMIENKNPAVRVNSVYALTQIVHPDTIEMLISLTNDPDIKVKAEALKNVKRLSDKVDTRDIVLEASLHARLKKALLDEKAKSEWIL